MAALEELTVGAVVEERGLFAGKYVAPVNSADVPDEMAVRLVVISPRFPFKDREPQDPPAVVRPKDVLDHRGNAPRLHRNMLVFAAFDENAHEDLMNSAKSYLAWKSIVDEKRQLNLDENQVKQATEQRDNALHSVDAQLAQGYHGPLCRNSGRSRRMESGPSARKPWTRRIRTASCPWARWRRAWRRRSSRRANWWAPGY